jgi:hypothetical protein
MSERRRLEEFVEPYEPTSASGTLSSRCRHEFRSSMEFGEIKWKGQENPYRYREFWHVQTCMKCGLTERESDEYYGDDMATIHITWRR